MGLITGLLGLPLAPVKGLAFVAEQVQQQAEDQYYDPSRIRKELEHVQRLREDGVLGEDEATAWEDQLVERLMTARERGGGGRHGG